MDNSLQKADSEKSGTFPDSEPSIVPTGSLCSAKTLLDSVKELIASINLLLPGACIATGTPLTNAIRIALADLPADRCPVSPSSTAVVSIEIIASVPPRPSLTMWPSESDSPLEPIVSIWPSINAAIWLIKRP